MDSLFRGELVDHQGFISKLSLIKQTIHNDLQLEPLSPQMVIDKVSKWVSQLNRDKIVSELIQTGLPKWAIDDYIQTLFYGLNKNELEKKVEKELGKNPFSWKHITDDIEEKAVPLGVLMHIGAGNALGLSAYSVLEGLLTGNINILKLPSVEGGMSVKLLYQLIQIEPRLKPYIYVIDVSSKNQELIKQLIDMVNGVIVWGADEAIQAIRQITPPSIPIIEWGHRLSFAYFTDHSQRDIDLAHLAKEVVVTDQLYCSSPQCVFYETDDLNQLNIFASKLSDYLDHYSKQYPSASRPMDVESQITWTQELVKMEEILDEKKLITNDKNRYSVMLDYQTKLIPSPLFRHIWVMPIQRKNLFPLLREHKGHLQTVGLSCNQCDLEDLSNILYTSGINRIMPCGEMSSQYSGEPHDGQFSLQRYVRIVTRRISAYWRTTNE